MTELHPLAILEQRDDAYEFDAADRLCVGIPSRRFLHGGVLFASMVDAMERVSGRPAIQVSAQFLSIGRPRDRVRLEPRLVADGRSFRQAVLSASVRGQPLALAQGSFGRREGDIDYGIRMPGVASWEDSEPRSVVYLLSMRIEKLYEFRLADGEIPETSEFQGAGGRTIAFWIKPRGGMPVDRLLLAVIADFAAIALHGALGRLASGSSLDNSIRYVCDRETDKVLCTVEVDGVQNGLCHITTRLFAADGPLLAVATQSMILRLWDGL